MNGILVINKESGVTSADVTNIIKDKFGGIPVGHTGTLDPIATGVLVCLIGKYTKLSDSITSNTKEYVATVKVGIETDSLDITGNIINSKKCVIDKDLLKKTISSFKKKYVQEVPLFSAVKINGKHLYEYARDNETVKLPNREVTIYDIELLEVSDDSFSFRCEVSKGTYIRSLIKDICSTMGIIGVMEKLERTKQGIFDINNSYTIKEVLDNKYEFYPLDKVFVHDDLEINEENRSRIFNGNVIDKPNSDKDYFYFYEQGKLKVIYKTHIDKPQFIKPLMFIQK